MTITEKNKIIAEFMGIAPKYDVQADCYYYIDSPWLYSRGTLEEVTKHINEYVKYNTSWDWLMPVVEKLCYNFDGQQFHHVEEKLNDALLSVKIDKVYEACINWVLEINKDKQNGN